MEQAELAAAFLAAGPTKIERPAAAIGARVQSLLGVGQAAWPDLAIAPVRFAGHLGRCARAARDPGAWLDRARGDGLYLACGCADGTPAALAHFEAHYIAQLPAWLASFKLKPDALDEVRQQLRARLLVSGAGATSPKIAEYAGEGPLAAWVQTVARRLVLSELRQLVPAESIDESGTAGLIPDGDPEIDLIKREHHRAFDQALRDALAVLSPESRTLLRLSYLERVSIDRLATMFQIHRSTAARRIEAAKSTLRAEALRLLKERLDLNDDGLRSFFRAMSTFHISIASALDPERFRKPG